MTDLAALLAACHVQVKADEARQKGETLILTFAIQDALDLLGGSIDRSKARAGVGQPATDASLTLRLSEALRAMCAEFRAHDLPYGSPAYAAATALLTEIDAKR